MTPTAPHGSVIVMRASAIAALSICLAAACGEPASPRVPITIFPEGLQLFPGDTARVRAVGIDTAPVWRSTAPAVATVDDAGLVTAVAFGVARVWGVRGADSAAATVFVLEPRCLLSVTVSPASVSLAVGDTTRVEASDSCGERSEGFTWTSADTAVATVESRGQTPDGRSTAMVWARTPGQVAIVGRAVADPVISAAIAVTIRAP